VRPVIPDLRPPPEPLLSPRRVRRILGWALFGASVILLPWIMLLFTGLGGVPTVTLVFLAPLLLVSFAAFIIWALSDSESPRHRRWYKAAKAVLVTMSVSVLSVAAVLAVATARVAGDQDACDVRWGGSDPEAIQCVKVRYESRWGLWGAFGRTADIYYTED
jgi:hypothetical protein